MMHQSDRDDFLRDGASAERRHNFLQGDAAVARWEQQHPWSLAAHLTFLASIREVLGDVPVDEAPWLGTDFRL